MLPNVVDRGRIAREPKVALFGRARDQAVVLNRAQITFELVGEFLRPCRFSATMKAYDFDGY